MPRVPGSRALAIALLLWAPAAARAQATAVRVPAEVVTAVTDIAAGFLGHLQFVAERPPESWPVALVPAAPASVIGGASSELVSLLTVAWPTSRDSALARFGSILDQDGWRRAIERASPGFQPPRPVPTTFTYCRGQAFVVLTAGDSSPTRSVTNAMLVHGRDGAYSPVCDTTSHVRTYRIGATSSSGEGIALPTLSPPEGATQRSAGTSVSTDGESTSTARIETTMSSSALLAFYSTQLARSGWMAATSAASDAIAVTTLDRAAGSDRWRLLLVITDEGAARSLFMRLRRAPAS